jgi:hypothetical protein
MLPNNGSKLADENHAAKRIFNGLILIQTGHQEGVGASKDR